MISVIVPTFRRPALLRDTLRSLQHQAYTDVEVLVCDNGADAATRAEVETLDDDRFRWIPRETNLGIQGNTLAGFRAARGRFVFKIDDDDTVEPNALALLHHALARTPEATLAFGTLIDVRWAPGSTDMTVLAPRAPAGALTATRFDRFVDVVAARDIHLGACLIRKEALDTIEVNPASATAFDLDILFALSAGLAVHVPEAHVYYRQHLDADSLTAPVPQTLGALEVYREGVNSGRLPLTPAVREGYTETALRAAAALTRHGRTDEARAILAALPHQLRNRQLTLMRAATYLPTGATWLARTTHDRYLRSLQPR